MTNARQAKRLFRPLADRHPDFAYPGGRELWLTPIRHTAARVFLDRSSNPDAFLIRWAIVATFIPHRDLSGLIGHCAGHIYPSGRAAGPAYWHWSDPDTVEAALRLIEAQALPHLRSLDSLEGWAAYYRETFPIARTGFPEKRLILDIALGDLEAARALLDTLLPHFRENKRPEAPIYQYMRRLIMTVADPLLAGDRPALANILHGWEAENIRGTNKIAPYWEPTPFPLEAASA